MKRCIVPLFVVLISIGAIQAADRERATGSVAVSVVGSRQQALPGVAVSSAGLPTTVTDAAGVARFVGVRTGAREFRATAAAFEPTVGRTTVIAGGSVELRLQLKPIELALHEVVVASSYAIGSTDAGGSGTSLDREAVDRLPAFGEDLYRTVAALPGTSSNDLSSRFQIRGGLDRESLVLLDGLELFEPFHLQDFQGVFSIVDPGMVGSADLVTGGMTSEFGDRSAGLLNLRSIEPRETGSEFGVSFSNLWARSQGRLAEDRGGWAVSGRRGFLDLVLELSGAGESDGEGDGGAPSPRYWDVFAKLQLDRNPRSRWTVSLLASGDSLTESENEDGEIEDNDSSYGNLNLWLNHRWAPGGGLFVESTLYGTRVDRDRRLFEQDGPDTAMARDRRTLDLFGTSVRALVELAPSHTLKWGGGARSYRADYDYDNDLEIVSTIADVRFAPPVGAFSFDRTFTESAAFAYVADRFRFGRLTGELGLRYDRDILDDDWLAPRLNLVFDAGKAGQFRGAAGRYHQSQRPNELDVSDGETDFFETERVDGYFAGWNRRFGEGWDLRVDLYERRVENPRPRYENLFSPAINFPEASNDRIRIAPQRVESRGLELLLVAPNGGRWDWWASYTWSETLDIVDGRDQARWFDQPHALRANVNYKPNPRWNFNALFTWHTGWPTTSLTARTEPDGAGGLTIVPEVGAFYEERLSPYHRLDLRIRRVVQRRRGSLTFYLDLQNVYNRSNARGFEYDNDAFAVEPDGSVVVTPSREDWLGLLPSFGLNWNF